MCVSLIGWVRDILPGGDFKVELENDCFVKCRCSGKIKQGRVRVVRDDRVLVEVGEYDLTRGRIVYRYAEDDGKEKVRP